MTKGPSEWAMLKAFIRSIRYFLLVVIVVFAPSIAAAIIRRNRAGLIILGACLFVLIPIFMGLLYSRRRKDLKMEAMLGKEIDRIGPPPVVVKKV